MMIHPDPSECCHVPPSRYSLSLTRYFACENALLTVAYQINFLSLFFPLSPPFPSPNKQQSSL